MLLKKILLKIIKYQKNFLDLFKKRKKKEIDLKTKDLYKIFIFMYSLYKFVNIQYFAIYFKIVHKYNKYRI